MFSKESEENAAFEMGRLKRTIETVMRDEGKTAPGALGFALSAASVLYGAGVALRNACYDTGVLDSKKLDCRVVSVGNLTAGGTGKTPMTIRLAVLLRRMGCRPVVISRGYGGHAEKEGAVVSDGREMRCDANVAGDEPFMMASRMQGVPVLVGGDRYKSGLRAASEFSPDIILMDDGFQHRRLHRDLDIVLVDAATMFGNKRLLPRGMLREPLRSIGRADAVVLTRCGGDCGTSRDEMQTLLRRLASGRGKRGVSDNMPIFRTRHKPCLASVQDGRTPLSAMITEQTTETGFAAISKARVFVFSGIAGNRSFRESVEEHAGTVTGSMFFPDHHRYSDEDLRRIADAAASGKPDFLATTEKDYVKVAGRMPTDIPVCVIGVRIVFLEEDERDFFRFLRNNFRSFTGLP